MKTARPGQWIRGRGWHQEKWTAPPSPNVEGFPTHASLDRVSPDNPVVLTHASGHASFANGKAMEVSGLTRKTPNPEGGEVLKDASGEPTGLLREKASDLIKEPALSAADQLARDRKILELADREALSKGVTSFQDAGSSFGTIDLMKQMVDEGAMGVRLWVMVREGNEAEAPRLAKYRTIDYGAGHLTVRAIKRQIDGALGSRGAWMLAPYSDKRESTGLNTTSVDSIRETARLAIANGYQLCVHAIGDRANRETLNIFEEAFKANPDKKDLRWRIEHAQHLRCRHPRFGQLGVIASMQGVRRMPHAGATRRLRARRALAEADEERSRRLERHRRSAGDVIIAGYYATVSRKSKLKVFYHQRSRAEALKSIVNGAMPRSGNHAARQPGSYRTSSCSRRTSKSLGRFRRPGRY